MCGDLNNNQKEHVLFHWLNKLTKRFFFDAARKTSFCVYEEASK